MNEENGKNLSVDMKTNECTCGAKTGNQRSAKVKCECTEERAEKIKKLLSDCEITADGNLNGTELQEIYRNATVGMESVEILRPISDDRGFRNLLMRQYRRYSVVAKEMEMYATKNEVELSDPSMFAKAMMYMTTMVNTIKDKSTSKLAEIMIQGINMGIISITKVKNHLSDEGRSNSFTDKMEVLLEKNLEEMKLFL